LVGGGQVFERVSPIVVVVVVAVAGATYRMVVVVVVTKGKMMIFILTRFQILDPGRSQGYV